VNLKVRKEINLRRLRGLEEKKGSKGREPTEYHHQHSLVRKLLRPSPKKHGKGS